MDRFIFTTKKGVVAMKKRWIIFSCAVFLFSALAVTTYSQPHFLDREQRLVVTGVHKPPHEAAVIVERFYDVELEEGIIDIPLIAIFKPGRFQTTIDRAKAVQERIETTFDLLEHIEDSYLFVDDDEGNPAVYWHHPSFAHWFRIITIYKEDAIAFGRANGNRHKLASYVKAQIKAHYTLFWRIKCHISDYERLEMDETRAGRIYKEIYLRMKEYAHELYPYTDFCELSLEERKLILKDSLARIGMLQRKRLTLLAHIIPRDWD